MIKQEIKRTYDFLQKAYAVLAGEIEDKDSEDQPFIDLTAEVSDTIDGKPLILDWHHQHNWFNKLPCLKGPVKVDL